MARDPVKLMLISSWVGDAIQILAQQRTGNVVANCMLQEGGMSLWEIIIMLCFLEKKLLEVFNKPIHQIKGLCGR